MDWTYVVKPGDTWSRISRKLGIHTEALKNANPQRYPDEEFLIPGEVLYVPGRKPRTYWVQKGDSWDEICRRFAVLPDDLQAVNPNVSEEEAASLQPGRQLTIPVGRGGDIVKDDTPYGYVEMMEDLNGLVRAYPFMEITTIGRSVEGRSIPALRLGSGTRQVHCNGAFHANEWITSLALMRFAEEYARAIRGNGQVGSLRAGELVAAATLWIVPMVNPDGVELVHTGIVPSHRLYRDVLDWNGGSSRFRDWKANLRGIDLNDQFPAGWEIEKARRAPQSPGPRDFPGNEPLSEPEAQAMAAFTRQRNFDMVIAFHTQGEEIYWNYRGFEPPEAEEWAERLSRVSGYRAVKLTDSDAGYKDWFIREYRRPGFTVELGRGMNPLPMDSFRKLYPPAKAIILEALAGGGSV